MSKNVTLRMDEKLLTKLRHKAVDAHMSLSAWVVSTLEQTVERSEHQESIRTEAIQHLQKGFSLGGVPLKREEIYDR